MSGMEIEKETLRDRAETEGRAGSMSKGSLWETEM